MLTPLPRCSDSKGAPVRVGISKEGPTLADILTRTQRSARMALVRGRDTAPEITVRALVRGLGFRYSLHDRELPGTPDLVFSSAKKAIFVHGCFWHRHPSTRCKLARLPKSRLDFWLPKLSENRARDLRVQRALNRLGWRYMIVWECHLARPERLASRISRFLQNEGRVT